MVVIGTCMVQMNVNKGTAWCVSWVWAVSSVMTTVNRMMLTVEAVVPADADMRRIVYK